MADTHRPDAPRVGSGPRARPIALDDLRSVHVVGAGGAGMSAIATVLASMGKRVSGSDLVGSAALSRLAALGIAVSVGHDREQVGDVDAVVISSAVAASNPEVVAARARAIPVLRRAELLAAICRERPTVAVAGTHGKTTTASMLSLILAEAGMHPSFLVGGHVNEVGGGAVWDGAHPKAPFVVEADESDGTFVELGARCVVVTNLEPDHLDHWGSFAALTSAFERFVADAPDLRVVGIDGPGTAPLGRDSGRVTCGSAAGADWRLVRPSTRRNGTRFAVAHHGTDVVTIDLPMAGLHNARNAVAAVATASELGAPLDACVRALGRYAGVARRWQQRGEVAGVTFIDDYAHLPAEVAMAVATARSGGWRRVVVVFQPHRYSRTAALGRQFSDAFAGTDVLAVTDVYPAGEPAIPGVTGKLVVDAVRDANPSADVAWLASRAEVLAFLVTTLRAGDLCLTLGAGDLTSLPDEVMAAVLAGTRPEPSAPPSSSGPGEAPQGAS